MHCVWARLLSGWIPIALHQGANRSDCKDPIRNVELSPHSPRICLRAPFDSLTTLLPGVHSPELQSPIPSFLHRRLLGGRDDSTYAFLDRIALRRVRFRRL